MAFMIRSHTFAAALIPLTAIAAAWSLASSSEKWLKPRSIAVKVGNSKASDYSNLGTTEHWRVIANHELPLR